MARRRVIVGVGEAMLAEHSDGDVPAGLALLIPMRAVLLGHEGIAISRLGQDATGNALLGMLRGAGVDVSHLQTDPDLATGRLQRRSVGEQRHADAQLAYDNLQWDSDLSDVSQRADAVVFSALARSGGQTRSTTDRFLAECALAIRLYDLTSRAAAGVGRGLAMSGLKLSEAAVVDDAALRVLVPGAEDKPTREAATEVIRQGDLTFLLVAEPGRPLEAHAATSSWAGQGVFERSSHESSIVGFLHGILAGWEIGDALQLAERVGRHAADHPGQPAPQELLERV